MRVYVVIMESGNIHSIYKSNGKARKAKLQLDNQYENATIKEFDVE